MNKAIISVVIGVLSLIILASGVSASAVLLWTQDCPGYIATEALYPVGVTVMCYGEEPTPTPRPAFDRWITHDDVDDFAAIPVIGGVRAGAALRTVFLHKSVGEGINWGLNCVDGLYPTQAECQPFIGLGYDRANWNLPYLGDGDKLDYFIGYVNANADLYDVLAFKYCYLDGTASSEIFWPSFDRVIAAITELQAQYPGKTFPVFTMPLAAVWYPGIQQYNNAVRAYAAAHSESWVFDIADIESHRLDGSACVDGQGREIMCAEYLQTGATGGHPIKPGRIRLAEAFWVMIYRIGVENGY